MVFEWNVTVIIHALFKIMSGVQIFCPYSKRHAIITGTCATDSQGLDFQVLLPRKHTSLFISSSSSFF